uniref:HMA domain-containing protein n=2 Tax=Cajanus cajan TaxID=3821 RepID=A0A151T4E2_CAJCA|nr:hypothetical protein KK1_016437 [Cajanus cajan]
MELHDDRMKKKAMKTASGLLGVESVSVDMKDKKMTLSGDVDPVSAVCKLRKLCQTELVSVETAKAEKKKVEATVPVPLKLYEANPLYYYRMAPPPYSQNYYISSVDENPSGCVIC